MFEGKTSKLTLVALVFSVSTRITRLACTLRSGLVWLDDMPSRLSNPGTDTDPEVSYALELDSK